MKIKFTKMHGCGNDYIYINCFEKEIKDIERLSIEMSHRHFGVGSDGVILICKSDIADAKMRMFNADGSEGKMCGNGIRCVGKYLFDNNMAHGDEVSIETLSGVKYLKGYKNNGEVNLLRVDMGKAQLESGKIPVKCKSDRMIGVPLNVKSKEYTVSCVSMGNPHCVVFMDDVENLEIEKIGPDFEHHEVFPEGVNTEFVKIIDKTTLQMRVWERGSGETWACGTGACACVAAAVENGFCEKGKDITVKLKGGDLIVNYTDERVFMTGNAVKVFDGEYEFN